VLLNFWGTWCAPCLEELPEFSTLYRSYRDHGLSLVAVATDEDAPKVSEVVEAHELTGHFVVGGEELAESQGDHDFPFTYLISAEGRIERAWDGYEPKCLADVETHLRTLLADPPGA
jgi:thiol-disulfide isomerase/thioredoxin